MDDRNLFPISRRDLLIAGASTAAAAAVPAGAAEARTDQAPVLSRVSLEVNGSPRTLEVGAPRLRCAVPRPGGWRLRPAAQHGNHRNAIYNATSVRARDYPITLDKLLAGLPAGA